MMHSTSSECSCNGSDLFSTPPTDTSVEKRIIYDVYPTGRLDGGPIELNVPAPDDDYTSLMLHCLELGVRIKKADGDPLPADEDVGFVNFPMHAMWSQVNTYISDELVTHSANTYPYNAVFEKELTYDKGVLESQFTSELIYMDTPGKMDSLTADNIGYTKRKSFTALSKLVKLRGSLHVPILRQERHLLNKCSIKIVLTPNNPKFYLMCPIAKVDSYKVVIETARLEVTRLKMNPDVINQHNMELQKKNAIYPIRRGEIKTFSIATGTMQETKENLFTGKVPRRLVIAFIDSGAFAGDVAKNPFNFHHFNLSSLCAYVDGERYPTRPLQPDFASDDTVEALQSLYNGTGIRDDNHGLIFDREMYGKGYTMYIIQLSPGEPDSMAYELTQRGNVRLEMKFKLALPYTVTAIVYAEYDEQLEIDRDRNVIFE